MKATSLIVTSLLVIALSLSLAPSATADQASRECVYNGTSVYCVVIGDKWDGRDIHCRLAVDDRDNKTSYGWETCIGGSGELTWSLQPLLPFQGAYDTRLLA